MSSSSSTDFNSVVKIFCTSIEPNFVQPWQTGRQSPSFGSGFVIQVAKKQILSNAHVVENATDIRVRKHGDSKKYRAIIAHISNEADLVLLDVEDEEFWTDLKPLQMAAPNFIPNLYELVSVIGYPIGGDNLSVTKGLVARVAMQNYVHSEKFLPQIQINSPINCGNSGGPVMLYSEVIGVAFQSSNPLYAQNIGQVIPMPVICQFIDDVTTHNSGGFPLINIKTQTMENTSLRKAHKLPKEKNGILITNVHKLDHSFGILRENDILLSIDSKEIAIDGTILLRGNERIDYQNVYCTKFVGDTIDLVVWRSGAEHELTVTLGKIPELCPRISHIPKNQTASYYIYAGFVFLVLNRSYFDQEFNSDIRKIPQRLLEHARYGVATKKGQQIVILSHIMSDEINIGYDEDFHYTKVNKVDNIDVDSLAHLVEIIETAEKEGRPFMDFDLDLHKKITIETSEAITATARILKNNNIISAKSADLVVQIKSALHYK
jgi:S1-C subfamily serine protease